MIAPRIWLCGSALLLSCFDANDPAVVDTEAAGTTETGAGPGTITSVGPTNSAGTTTTPDTTTSPDDTGTTAASVATDTTDGESTDAGGDRDPPEVVSIEPAHGSSGVMDDPVTIDFSEPVDTSTVEAAFPNATQFEWSNDSRTVGMVIPFPFEDSPVLYDLVVPTSVRDLAGNGLETEFVATVGLAALLTTTLEFDFDLTGNEVEETGASGTFFLAGDTDADLVLYTGISFPLDALPDYDSILRLRAASFGTQITRMNGDPNDAAMGGFVLDHVTFDARDQIPDPVVVDPAFHDLHASGDVSPGDSVSVDVTSALDATWSFGGTHLQFRVRPTQASANGVADTIYLRRQADENDATIAEGVADPDEANRARVEIEYFVE